MSPRDPRGHMKKRVVKEIGEEDANQIAGILVHIFSKIDPKQTQKGKKREEEGETGYLPL